jgi:hypothetical protein
MRAKPLCVVVLGAAVSVALAAPIEARRATEPKAGGYVGKVTNARGKGAVQLIVATFISRPGAKPRKGPRLFRWTGKLRCDDGSTRRVGPSVFAPLKGSRFRGRSKAGPQTVTLKGRFTSNTRLRGTARVVTAGKTPATRCDTGAVTFKAHRR